MLPANISKDAASIPRPRKPGPSATHPMVGIIVPAGPAPRTIPKKTSSRAAWFRPAIRKTQAAIAMTDFVPESCFRFATTTERLLPFQDEF